MIVNDDDDDDHSAYSYDCAKDPSHCETETQSVIVDKHGVQLLSD